MYFVFSIGFRVPGPSSTPFLKGLKTRNTGVLTRNTSVCNVFSTKNGTYLRPKNGVRRCRLQVTFDPQELEEAFRELDKDGSGEIDFPEYLYLGGGKNHIMLW